MIINILEFALAAIVVALIAKVVNVIDKRCKEDVNHARNGKDSEC